MGVYNCGSILASSVESILAQTYSNWEFIICDDGSNDNTFKVLQQYQDKDPRFIILRNESNRGLAYSLNKCLKKASGEYIARQDADDLSKPQRFEKQVYFLESNPEYSFVGSLVELYDENGVWCEKTNQIEKPDAKSFLWTSAFVHPSIMFRRKDLINIGGYRVAKETRRAEDYDLFMRMYAKNMKGYNLQEVLLSYHMSSKDMAKRKFKYRIDEVIVRYKGFKALKLFPRGYIYVVKPLLVGLFPQSFVLAVKKISKNRG